MQVLDFQKIKNEFENADVDDKIEMYSTAEGLTKEQYKELLTLFPIRELYKLEEALR